MGHRIWIAGDKLTTSRAQDLEDEGISRVTSTTRPVATEGMFCFETDTDRLSGYDGSSWVDVLPLTTNGIRTWTPVLIQSGTVAATVDTAVYVRSGPIIEAWCNLGITGTGTAGNGVTVTVPVDISAEHATGSIEADIIGTGRFYDSSTATSYAMAVTSRTTTGVGFLSDATGQQELGGIGINVAVANGDRIHFHVRYLAT